LISDSIHSDGAQTELTWVIPFALQQHTNNPLLLGFVFVFSLYFPLSHAALVCFPLATFLYFVFLLGFVSFFSFVFSVLLLV